MVLLRFGTVDIIRLPSSIFLNKLAFNVAANVPKNLPFCSFTLFQLVIVPFHKISLFSEDVITFRVSFMSLLFSVISGPNCNFFIKNFINFFKFYNSS